MRTALALYRIGRLRRYGDPDDPNGDGNGDSNGDGNGPPADGDGGGSPTLEEQARAALEEIRNAGAEVPKVLEDALGEIKKARDEAAKTRKSSQEKAEKKAQEQRDELLKAIGSALGLETGDGDVDVEAVQQRSNELESELRELKLERRFQSVAGDRKADPDLAFTLFKTSDAFQSVSLDDDDLEETLGDWIDEALEKHPNLKAGPGVPNRSGNDFSGGTGSKTFTRDELRNMTPEEINEQWDAISEQMKAGKVR